MNIASRVGSVSPYRDFASISEGRSGSSERTKVNSAVKSPFCNCMIFKIRI